MLLLLLLLLSPPGRVSLSLSGSLRGRRAGPGHGHGPGVTVRVLPGHGPLCSRLCPWGLFCARAHSARAPNRPTTMWNFSRSKGVESAQARKKQPHGTMASFFGLSLSLSFSLSLSLSHARVGGCARRLFTCASLPRCRPFSLTTSFRPPCMHLQEPTTQTLLRLTRPKV